MIKQSTLFLFVTACFITGCDKDSNMPILKDSNMPIQGLVGKAVLANGTEFFSKKLVVLDPKTGNEIPPCDPTGISNSTYQSIEGKKITGSTNMKKDTQKCETEVIITDSDSALKTALESSRKPIPGQIKKNGKVIPADFVVTVKALYKDPNPKSSASKGFISESFAAGEELCETDYGNGEEFPHCARDR